MVRPPKSVDVGLDLKIVKVTGTWEPNDAERKAAWELYVELMTRAAVIPLDGGLLRETATSLYSMFASSRSVLRRYGPDLAAPKPQGQFNLAFLTVSMLNFVLRPVLSYWHPELEAWELRRPADIGRLDHERAWPRNAEFRDALSATRGILENYAALFANACGVPHLAEAIPPIRPYVL